MVFRGGQYDIQCGSANNWKTQKLATIARLAAVFDVEAEALGSCFGPNNLESTVVVWEKHRT